MQESLPTSVFGGEDESIAKWMQKNRERPVQASATGLAVPVGSEASGVKTSSEFASSSIKDAQLRRYRRLASGSSTSGARGVKQQTLPVESNFTWQALTSRACRRVRAR